MARCIFDNLSPAQAKVLADWFEGQGESNCVMWFEEQRLPSPSADIHHPNGYCEILENGDVLVHCRS